MNNLKNIRPVPARASDNLEAASSSSSSSATAAHSWDYPSIQDESRALPPPGQEPRAMPSMMGRPSEPPPPQFPPPTVGSNLTPAVRLQVQQHQLHQQTQSAYQRLLFPSAARTATEMQAATRPQARPPAIDCPTGAKQEYSWPHPLAQQPQQRQQPQQQQQQQQQAAFSVQQEPVIPVGQQQPVKKQPQEGDEDEEERSAQEEMFPKGKTADLQKSIDRTGEKFIGLEYVVEIQQNTIKKMQPHFSCLLCDALIRITKDSKMSAIELAKGHLKSNAHKIKYLAKFFPNIKTHLVDSKKTEPRVLQDLVERIVQHFALMPVKVKLVVGFKLFKRKQVEIKTMVENSTHFREDQDFVAIILGKETADSIYMPPKKSMIDQYADAFEEFERVEREAKKAASKKEMFEEPPKENRNLDAVLLEGTTNPDPDGGGDSSSVMEISGESGDEQQTKKRGAPPKRFRERSSHERSRSHEGRKRSKTRRSRSRSRHRRRSRSRPKGHRRSKSREHRRSRSRSKGRRRSRSREHRRSRSRSIEHRRSRSRSKGRRRSRSREHRRSRSRTRERRRSRSSSREHKKHGDRRRSRSRDENTREKSGSRDQRREVRSRSRGRKYSRERSKSRSRSTTPLEKRHDDNIIKFLDEEDLMLERLEEEQRPFLGDSQRHPDYAARWKEFYSRKCDECATRGVPPPRMQDITKEWVEEWKAYFFDECDRKKREATNKLLNQYRLLRATVLNFERRHPEHMEKRGQRVPYKLRFRPPIVDKKREEEEEKEEEEEFRGRRQPSLEAVSPGPMRQRSRSPPPPSPPLSQISDASLGGREDHLSRGPSSLLRGTANEDATVIGTLRLLSALEPLLDELGGEVMAGLGRANSLEVNRGFGKSSELVDDPNFFRLLDAAKEKLTMKMQARVVAERHAQVARICVNNIDLLMQKSRCERGDVLAIREQKVATTAAASAPAATSSFASAGPTATATSSSLLRPLDPTEVAVKAAIANTVAEQFRRAGRTIAGDELTQIVEKEYLRVKGNLSRDVLSAISSSTSSVVDDHSCRPPEQQQQPPTQHQDNQWNLPIPQQQQRQEQHQSQEKQHHQSSSALNVDWDRLESAVKTATSSKPVEQQPQFPTYGHKAVQRPSFPQQPSRGQMPTSQHSQVQHHQGRLQEPFRQSSSQQHVLPQDPSHRDHRQPQHQRQPQQEQQQPQQQQPQQEQQQQLPSVSGSRSQVEEDDYDELTVEDLKSLFQNFKDLDRENQTHLIAYMKKLEKTNPRKVMELKSHIHGEGRGGGGRT